MDLKLTVTVYNIRYCIFGKCWKDAKGITASKIEWAKCNKTKLNWFLLWNINAVLFVYKRRSFKRRGYLSVFMTHSCLVFVTCLRVALCYGDTAFWNHFYDFINNHTRIIIIDSLSSWFWMLSVLDHFVIYLRIQCFNLNQFAWGKWFVIFCYSLFIAELMFHIWLWISAVKSIK